MTTTATSPTTTTTSAHETKLREFYALIDAWGYDRFNEYVTEDLHFRFGNAESLTGRSQLVALTQQIQSSVAGMSHTLHRFFHATDGEHVTVECDVAYTRLDGTQLQVPAGVVFRFTPSGLISDYRIYVDLSALHT